MAARRASGAMAGPLQSAAVDAPVWAPDHATLQRADAHHAALAALAAAGANALPAAATLAVRWLGAAMLAGLPATQVKECTDRPCQLVPPEAIELVVAATFLPESGMPMPGTYLLSHSLNTRKILD